MTDNTPAELVPLLKRKLELEIRKLEADVAKAASDADLAETVAWSALLEQHLEESSDWLNGVFYFVGDVDNDSVVSLMQDVSTFRRYRPRHGVTLYLNSDGGLNTAGLHLYEFLCDVPRLTIHVRGWAASMATVILQAAKVRRMDAEAHLMIHKSNYGVPRLDADSFMVEAETLKVWSAQVLRILAGRSHLTEKQLDDKTKHRDWYLTGPEALRLGFVDELV